MLAPVQHELAFFAPPQLSHPQGGIAVTQDVTKFLQEQAVVAGGISGGKDSMAMAICLDQYLDEIGHSGPRVLIHSDLGVVEWRDSIRSCERLAKRLNRELIVVRRGAGDLMDRWETRWRNNVARYASLSCVKIILPWSTPGMRFCTSELKTSVICQELTKRYPGSKILSAVGVRADESSARAKMPVSAPQPKLSARNCLGLNWNPILHWLTPYVFEYLKAQGEPLHEAYTRYNSSRVSCTFCIMGSLQDLHAAASCPDNVEIYRRMVRLEIQSTFALQGSRWLADIAPSLLNDAERRAVGDAKRRALARAEIEAKIPPHLLYISGWPTQLPTFEEARLLGKVRGEVASLLEIEVGFTEPEAIINRYADLIAEASESRRRKAGGNVHL